MDSLATEVENEKLCAIGRRNMVQSMTKQNELEKNQLQVPFLEFLYIHLHKRLPIF